MVTTFPTAPDALRSPVPRPLTAPVLDVVVPVHDEERDLEPCVRRLHDHLRTTFPYPFRITIADNASTDATPQVARRLVADLREVTVLRLAEKGRGRALRAAWSSSDADVLAYMDVDLSTDLAAVLPLVAPLISGHSDLAIGTRLAPGARVVRGAKREVISRCYNLVLRTTLAARFSDAQCGFKAIRRDVALTLLPLVEDEGWFFDTELLVLAERSGLRVHEVPVDWVDDPDSRVDIVATALTDLRGVLRLATGFVRGSVPVSGVRARFGRHALVPGDRRAVGSQLVRFMAVGVASTIAYALVYVALRSWFGPQASNLLALLLTAVANTAANRRLTFGIRESTGMLRQQAQALLVFVLGLALTSLSLVVLDAAASDPARWLELAVLLAASLVATVTRFVAMRWWVFADRGGRS